MPIIQFSLLQLLFLFYLSLTLLKKDSLSKSMNQKGFVQIPLLIATIISIVLAFAVMSVNSINMTKRSPLTVQEPTLAFGGVVLAIIMWDIIIGAISWLFCTVYNRTK